MTETEKEGMKENHEPTDKEEKEKKKRGPDCTKRVVSNL